MRRLVVALALVALAAGCGGGKKAQPEYALLTGVQAKGDSVTFTFESEPRTVKSRFVSKASLAECGSGAAVPLKGAAYAVVNFTPAMTARIEGEKVTPTYTGPKRLQAPGPTVLEVAKICDFEADVGWAIGLSRRSAMHVSTEGGTVTVTFG